MPLHFSRSRVVAVLMILSAMVCSHPVSAQRIYDAPTTMANLIEDSGFGQCKGLVKSFFSRLKLNNVYASTHANAMTASDTLQLATVWGQENRQVMAEIVMRKVGRDCVAQIELMFSVAEDCPTAMTREPEYSLLNDHLGVLYAEAENGSRKYLYPAGKERCMIIYRHNAKS